MPSYNNPNINFLLNSSPDRLYHKLFKLCFERDYSEVHTTTHRLYSWSQGHSNLRSQCRSIQQWNSGYPTRLRATHCASWRTFERIEIHLVCARIPFTCTMLCSPILRLPHKTPNEFWAVRHYTWHKVASSGVG